MSEEEELAELETRINALRLRIAARDRAKVLQLEERVKTLETRWNLALDRTMKTLEHRQENQT